ncbi:carcinoembryonic antigen-related cell adhesion molecule 2-like [Thalassophryne amazonica]|uniref:carcinoembryonic antigen-related cell adhesion molecule 2-like n=1 Tax=Thalassophryne amazonica TaxID=390379 RepID=UPI00147266B3|nr:carcinoembryonic antigen-related cell adhesion molecule 2-like [Thalassophryne amazonica]
MFKCFRVSDVVAVSNATQLVEFSSSVSLTCTSSGSALSFLWLNVTSEVTDSDRVQITDGGSTLIITNVTRYDHGPFTCHVSNPVSNGSSNQLKLSISFRVSDVVAVSNATQLVEFSSSVSLTCTSSGSALSFLWLNVTSEVTDSDRVQITDGGSTLIITNVTRYDHGPFTCHVSNPVSNGSSNQLKLSISFGPENINLRLSPSQLWYGKGSDVTLCFVADSKPAAQFDWYLNGETLSHSGPELRLNNIQQNQTGNYNCRVFNEQILRYQILQIHPSIAFLSPPGLTKAVGILPDDPLTATVGDTVTFSTTLNPSQTNIIYIDWIKDSTPIVTYSEGGTIPGPDYRDRITLFANSGALELRSVTLKDSGVYYIDIDNNGTRHVDSRTLDVYVRVSDVVAVSNATQLVEFSSSVSLTCTSSGSALSFLWLNVTSEVTDSDRVQITDGGSTLIITNVTRYDHGPFTCHVSNPVSNGSSNQLKLSISSVGILPDDPLTAAVGDTVRFNTTLNPSQTQIIYIEWIKDSTPIGIYFKGVTIPRPDYRGRITLFPNSAALELRSVTLKDSGVYYIDIDNNGAWHEDSRTLDVYVRVSDVVAVSNATQLVEFSSSVSLTCTSSGSALSFLWLNVTSEVTDSDRVQITDGGSTLIITTVTRYDHGPFTCHVSNPVSNGSSNQLKLSISFSAEGPSSSLSPGAIVGTTIACLLVGLTAGVVFYIFKKRFAVQGIFCSKLTKSHDSSKGSTSENTRHDGMDNRPNEEIGSSISHTYESLRHDGMDNTAYEEIGLSRSVHHPHVSQPSPLYENTLGPGWQPPRQTNS